ncbi:hypothetical protein F4810DRAFT_693613 [Camillea tinctor]|nr:hypothetical protein F4810DRAFT_693613 [Camillea tinctor]
MNGAEAKKYFAWGCSVPIDAVTRQPISSSITHCETCECPGPNKDGILIVILERACRLHESNVVKYMIPVVNNLAREAAIKVGINLRQGIEDLPIYKDKVRWVDGICTEILGRGFTAEEFAELEKLPRGQLLCSWVL